MPSRLRSSRSRLSRTQRTFALVCLGIYLLSVTGLPLPAPASQSTAEASLAPCGCPAEAAARGACCCSKASGPGCCLKRNVAKAPETSAQKTKLVQAASRKAGLQVISIAAARQCQGLAEWWWTGDAGLPLVVSEVQSVLQLVERVSPGESLPLVIPQDPPVPPPRALVRV